MGKSLFGLEKLAIMQKRFSIKQGFGTRKTLNHMNLSALLRMEKRSGENGISNICRRN